MAASYLLLKAARPLARGGRSSTAPQIDGEGLTTLAGGFKKKAEAARESLAHARAAFLRRKEAER
jgi:hypothetical protein